MANAFETWGKKYGLILGILVGLAIWVYPVSPVITVTQHKLLSIFGGAVVLWITIADPWQCADAVKSDRSRH